MRQGLITALLFTFALAPKAKAAIVLNFDNLTPAPSSINGANVPDNAVLDSDHYLTAYGIHINSFTLSLADPNVGVAVVDIGSSATSLSNGIGGLNTLGQINYGAPIFFSFWNPLNTSSPATTNFFSVRGDLNALGGGASITLSAFDINGSFLGSNTQIDNGGETWTLFFPGIHSVRFPGSPNPSFGGIALDDVTFNPVAVPEPASLSLLAAAILPLLARQRRTASKRTP